MERKPFRILAVAGSLRQGSFNQGLLRAAKEVAPEWVEVQFFDISQLPFFNEDVEATGDPEPVRRFKDVMGAVLGTSGSANAQAALRGVLGRIGAVVVPDPQVLVPQASRLFNEQVDLHDEGTREEIRQLVEEVVHWCRRVQPEEPVSTQSVTAP